MTRISPQAPEAQPNADGSSPLVALKRVLVLFIRELFAGVPANHYRWDPNTVGNPEQEGSEIWIGGEGPIDPEVVGARPAITVSRGPGAFHGVGLGDQAYIDTNTGAHVKMDMIPTTAVISVLSRFPQEAEELAWFVVKHIWNLRDELIRGNHFILYLGQRPTLSPASPAGSLVGGPDTEHNWSAVTASFPVYLQHMEVAMPLNKTILREMRMVATVNGPQLRPRPRSILQGTSVFQPTQASVPATPTTVLSTERAPALPQTGLDEAQSSEPLTVRFKT